MTSRMIPFPGTYQGEREEATVMVPLARLSLTAICGPLRGQLFQFDGMELVIGRAQDCTVSIPSKSVSRHHARIEFQNGSYWLIPDKTVNGTRLNGVLVQAPSQLADRDQITIAESTFTVGYRDPGADQDFDNDALAPPPQPQAYPVYPDPPPRASGYPTVQPGFAPTVTGYPAPPPGYAQPAPRPTRWWLWAIAISGFLALIAAVVIVTIKVMQPAQPIAQLPLVVPPPVVVPPPAPAVKPQPKPEPPPLPPKPKLTGVLAVETTKVIAGERGTLVDIVPVGTAVARGGAVAHHRLFSAAFNQAYDKLRSLERKYGDSEDYADFIAEARQNFKAAQSRRVLKPIAADAPGTVTKVLVKPGAEIRDHEVIAEISVARITVPVAAVDGDGKKCTADVAGQQLAGTLLAVGSTERTLELDRAPHDASPGELGEVKIHCAAE